MKRSHDSATSLTELAAYQGRGTRGWRVEADGTRQEAVVIEAGEVFGGEWPERQLWQIIEGEGTFSCDATAPRVHLRPGDGYRISPNERRLIIADSRMRILITSL
jgi:quercetin dioxygenase-like cupin family protein